VVTDDEREHAWAAVHDALVRMPGWAAITATGATDHGDGALCSTAVPAGQPTIPPGGTVDPWVATDGNYLVALEVNGMTTTSSSPTSVKLEVTNINDPSLSVSAPS
jgi:hypothetical protein